MSYARYRLTVSHLPNGQVLAARGVNEGDLNSADLCDLSNNTWSPAADMNTAHTGATATNRANGDVLVAGGFSKVAEVVRSRTMTCLGPRGAGTLPNAA